MREFVKSVCRERLGTLQEAVRAARKAPHDAEALHDLRVAARRFQQCLRLFGPFFEPRHVRKMRRRLRCLLDQCAAPRNYDVALAVLGSLGIGDQELIAQLRRGRAREESRLVRHLRSWRGERSPRRWGKWLRPGKPVKGAWHDGESPADNARRVLPETAAEWFAAGDRAAHEGGTQQLHRFRLLGKRFRYTLELFAAFHHSNRGRSMGRRLQVLRRVQDALGGISDCDSVIDLLAENPNARKAVEALLRTRTEAFHALWTTIRAQSPTWQRWLRKATHDGTVHPETR